MNKNHIKFCQELASGKSQTDSYKSAFKSCKKDSTARTNASVLLTNTNIFEYYQSLLKKTAEKSEITRERILNEYAKIGFSSIAHLHNTWIERKEFEELTEDQKASIMEISTQTRVQRDDNDNLIEIDFVKIKLYDKLKALELAAKMLGFNEPDKIDMTTKGESIKQTPTIIVQTEEQKNALLNLIGNK